ncbi:hypothetical protein LVB87_15275 [Lysobacter sp. KIS68-7]|uniref:hypothetical protein n=1 Tax=Lysobacter sp. KIS68-7 TaxID=2904252 RepID=UPI001E43958A|nr:hypothetical protein [Lysobacter sp. KIS68-7]UHQ19528.1 hypothetical protein LVB87_15275 [Lysobacter sp. KIS68-7]
MAFASVSGCALIAVACVLPMLLSRIRAPLGADEGYLWFGVQQLLRGRLPHRDFRSYEPGRYAWCGAFALVLGRDLVVLRVATHVFFACALCAALFVLQGMGVGWAGLCAASIALTVLAHPQHKQFEHGWMLVAWACNTAWLLQPSLANLAMASGATGLALFFGFNLFLYFGAALATTLVLGFASGRALLDLDAVRIAAIAGVVGMGPFLLLLASPGFARQFLRRRVSGVVARGEANLSLPLPWPWRAVPAQLRNLDPARQQAFAWIFAALFAVPVVAGLWAWFAPQAFDGMAAGVLAAAALAPWVGHHAASRADPPHLTQAMGPLCLVALLVAAAFAPMAMWLVAAFAAWLAWPLQHMAHQRRFPGDYTRIAAGRIDIDCPHAQARIFHAASQLAEGAARDALYVAPAYPALYAHLSRDTPVYDTFPLYPADAPAQREVIEAMERVAVRAALISDAPIDGRDALRFSNTHPAVWAHLHAHFDASRRTDLGEDVYVFTRAVEA